MARKISETVYDMFTEGKTGNPSSRDCVFRDNGLVKYKLYDTVIAQRKIGSTFVTVFIPHGGGNSNHHGKDKRLFTFLYTGVKGKR